MIHCLQDMKMSFHRDGHYIYRKIAYDKGKWIASKDRGN